MTARLGSFLALSASVPLAALAALAAAPSCASFAAARDVPDAAAPARDAAEPADAADAGAATGDANAGPPPSFVQENQTNAPSASKTTVSFVSDLEPHDAILVATAVFGGPELEEVGDTQGNVFVRILGPWSGTAGGRFYLLGAFDIAKGGPDTINLAFTGSGRIDAYVHAYRGVAAADAVDVSVANNGTAGGIDGIASTPFTTRDPDELVFAYATSDTVSGGTGFTVRSNAFGNVTEDRTAASPGSYRATATMTTGSDWTLLVATLRGR